MIRKSITTLLFAAAALVATAQGKKTTITGEIASLADGAKIELQNVATYGFGDKIADEAQVADGKFVFTFTIDEPRYFTIEAGPRNGNFSIVISPGDQMVIKGATLRQAEFSGSALMAQFDEIVRQPEREYVAANRATTEDKWPANMEAFQKRLPSIYAKYADTFWAPVMIYYYSGYLKPSKEVYELLSPKVKASFYGKKLAQHLDTYLIGRTAPAFMLKDVDGKEHTLAELTASHKYVLIDFWASWCGPCRKLIPSMKEFAVKYAPQGLVLLSISTDTDRAAWIKAMEEEAMPWLNLLDDRKVKQKYGVGGIPSVFLIESATGKVIFEKEYGDNVRIQLEKAFGF